MPKETQKWPGVVTVAFGTSVAMWGVGYLGHFPGLERFFPAPLLLSLLLLIQVGGGRFAARSLPGSPLANGALVGFLVSTLNLLVLGSFLAEGEAKNFSERLVQVGGFLLAGSVLGGAGGLAGSFRRPRDYASPALWLGRFACVGGAATLLLLVIGGFVTSYEAGLAVPDWPTSYQANMFLFPLSRMVGNIYLEHAHRLFGALVGVLTLAFSISLVILDRRRWLRLLALLLFLLVCAQGYMGGMRVTLDSGGSLEGKILRVVHGVTGQVFFGFFLAMAFFVSKIWRETARAPSASAAGDRTTTRLLLGALLLQLFLGALVRHLGQDPWFFPHLLWAFIVLFVAIFAGSRARVAEGDAKCMRVLGGTLLGLIFLQFLLGILAFLLGGSAPGSLAEVLFATAHQTTGALILGDAVLLLAAAHRLHTPLPADTAAHAPAGLDD